MPTRQSNFFRGFRRIAAPSTNRAGDATELIVSHTFDQDVNTTDVLEMFPVDPGMKIMAVDFASENLGAITLNIGYITGEAGDITTVRTCGSELFAAQAVGTPASVPLIALAALAQNGSAVRSIGIVPSANIVAGTTKKIHLRIRYTG